MFSKAAISLFVSSIFGQILAGDYINVNVARTIHLTELQKIRENIGIVIQNTGEKPANKYYFVLDEKKNASLAYVAVQTKADKQTLSIARESFDKKKKLRYYSVNLPSLRPEGKIVLNFKLIFLRGVEAYPAAISQTQSAAFLFSDNVYFSSPYPTTSLKTNIKLSSNNVLEYSQEPSPVQKDKDVISYGPFSDVPAFSHSEVKVHFPYTKTVLYARTMVRELEVSHWGNNLAVEENYDVANHGPELQGSFSRQIHFALEMYSSGAFVNSFEFELPGKASDAYFRDEIGNVSTSNFRSGMIQSYLKIEPRFPIYGGWHYNWNHGYNLPLSSSLSILASNPQKYILRVPLLNSLPSVPILNFTLKVVLPDGAKDVKVTSLPIDGYTLENGIHFTYLDTVGRPTVTIHKENVIKQHWVDIEIEYTYEPFNLLLKPLGVFCAFMACFVSSMIVSRLNMHLGSKKFAKQK